MIYQIPFLDPSSFSTEKESSGINAEYGRQIMSFHVHYNFFSPPEVIRRGPTVRACKFCADSHAACETQRPCRRCVRRGLICQDRVPCANHSNKLSHYKGIRCPLNYDSSFAQRTDTDELLKQSIPICQPTIQESAQNKQHERDESKQYEKQSQHHHEISLERNQQESTRQKEQCEKQYRPQQAQEQHCRQLHQQYEHQPIHKQLPLPREQHQQKYKQQYNKQEQKERLDRYQYQLHLQHEEQNHQHEFHHFQRGHEKLAKLTYNRYPPTVTNKFSAQQPGCHYLSCLYEPANKQTSKECEPPRLPSFGELLSSIEGEIN
eukprot:TRINITY_DN3932_c0_g1_i9.p1 TRINITY_DN3932_c0_g1~~TRINITY_DN3932_c0_g1_i9.p1  ORF type:complete len:320 (+),score=52.28 TRINITY_DN3932_c0_g1_i9:63-1022(+)